MRFLAGLVIGLLIGTGGTLAVTAQDVFNAGKTSYQFVQDISEVINKNVDPDTAAKIMREINQQDK